MIFTTPLNIQTQVSFAGLVDKRTLASVRLVPVPWTSDDWGGFEVGRWLFVPPGPSRPFVLGALLVMSDQWRRAGARAMVRAWFQGAWWELARSGSVRDAVTWWPRRSAAGMVVERWALGEPTLH